MSGEAFFDVFQVFWAIPSPQTSLRKVKEITAYISSTVIPTAATLRDSTPAPTASSRYLILWWVMMAILETQPHRLNELCGTSAGFLIILYNLTSFLIFLIIFRSKNERIKKEKKIDWRDENV